MNIQQMVQSKGFKLFMGKVYGWGAAIVILGAMFKIQHWPGAGIMLVCGLSVEAFIFFMSAFEPPHAEPDWSLVYPELAGMYDLDDDHGHGGGAKAKTPTEELDNMLENAKIGPELIESLGTGLRSLSDNASKLANVSNASAATDEYVSNMKSAATSVGQLNTTYQKTADALQVEASASEAFVGSMKNATDSANKLASSYTESSQAMKSDVEANQEYIDSIKLASKSAQDLAAKYIESGESLAASAQSLGSIKVDGSNYNEKLQEVAKNLGALNAVYELQLQSSNDQIELSKKLQGNMSQFVINLNETIENTAKYKEQSDILTRNLAALNNVYGNMLTAMNVKA